jgi:hypothetical protein
MFGIMGSVQCGQDSGDNIVKRFGVPVGLSHDLKTAQRIDEIPGERTSVMTARNATLVLTAGDQTMEQFFHAVQMVGNRCVDRWVVGGQFDRAIDGQATTPVTLPAWTFYDAAELDFDQATGAPTGADCGIEPCNLPVAITAERRHEGIVLAAEKIVEAAFAQPHSVEQILHRRCRIAFGPEHVQGTVQSLVGIEFTRSSHGGQQAPEIAHHT